MGGTSEHFSDDSGLLIDWITLRVPLHELGPNLQERLFEKFETIACFGVDLETLLWEKKRFCFEQLASDSKGLFLTVKWIGPTAYLYIGASPASLIHGCNVFGNLDVKDGAETLIAKACVALQSFLPPAHVWECQRIDVTGNYALPDAAAVKIALKQLLATDSVRRRASSSAKGGNTVYWSGTSDLLAGKAYHKGPHLAHMVASGKIAIPEEWVRLADRLLRLEMRIGARWFRRMKDRAVKFLVNVGGLSWEEASKQAAFDWWNLSADRLAEIYRGFFGRLVGNVEVTGMERADLLHQIMQFGACTEGAARSVLGTYYRIKAEGYEAVRDSMAKRTFIRHKKALLAAGMSEADLVLGNVYQLQPVRIMLASPVRNWQELRRVA